MQTKHSTLLATAVLVSCASSSAQDNNAARSNVGPSSRPQTIIVTGSSVGSAEAAPVSVLTGDELERRRGTSLGDTLSRVPGVSSTYFGPNANRPMIRGQDGERVRILANGGASADASTLSFDHAVPIDPLVIERLEVLRGPAALLYGGSAIGGAVNVIDNRIPTTAPDKLHAATLLRLGGAARERGASALLEGGSAAGGSGLAWHVDGFTRRQDDMRVPGFNITDEATGTVERRDRLVNSSSQSKGGAAGVSHVWQGGHAGFSVDTFRRNYGSIAEEAIRIDMRRERLAFEAQSQLQGTPFAQARVQAAATRYAHDELEEGAVGTQFRNRSQDARVELRHRPWALGGGSVSGTWGAQVERGRFSALGEEAFVPPSRSTHQAVFALEQWEPMKGTALVLGLRAERVQVDSAGDTDPAEPRFGAPVQRRFTPKSASFGVQHQATAAWQLLANVSTTQRAPAPHELYANGVHAATGAYEQGDAAQGLERARHLELGTVLRLGGLRLKLNAFNTRYGNYIALVPTGSNFDEVDAGGVVTDSFPVYAYLGVPARLRGGEVEAQWAIDLGSSTMGKVDLGFQLDVVRGTNQANGQPLPRLAPMRATLSADWSLGSTLLRVELQHAAKQNRVPAFDTATPAWTQLHLLASHRWSTSAGDLMAYAKLGNLTNELAFNAGTLGSVRERAPMPGRSVGAGVQWQW